MIVTLAYEEISSLRGAAELALETAPTGGAVVAPPEHLAHLEGFREVSGDLSLTTLSEQRTAELALEEVLAVSRERMEVLVLAQYVGSDDSVNAYFDYAHVLTVLERVRAAGRRMTAIIELVTGRAPTPESSTDITFPD